MGTHLSVLSEMWEEIPKAEGLGGTVVVKGQDWAKILRPGFWSLLTPPS